MKVPSCQRADVVFQYKLTTVMLGEKLLKRLLGWSCDELNEVRKTRKVGMLVWEHEYQVQRHVRTKPLMHKYMGRIVCKTAARIMVQCEVLGIAELPNGLKVRANDVA